MPGFDALDLPAPVLAALGAMGYTQPTPIQAAAIPRLATGKDALIQARTGSGKTTAFGVACVRVGSKGPGVRALVLVPTRELARQVADEIRDLGLGSPFRAVAVTGGVQQEREERTLGGDVRCVVATPGRLLALLEERKVDLGRVELVVLDEADRMLDMGFMPEVERVLAVLPSERQTALVSATLDRRVHAVAARQMREPVEVRVDDHAIPETLDHARLNVFAGQKDAAVVALLKAEDPERAIVFVRTRERVVALTKLLKAAGFAADPLQGEMSHDQRRHVFDLFSRGVSRVLVATDLASRGLDVPEMQLVVNADVPENGDDYLHRAGRAARMDRPGRVVTLVLPDEKEARERFERAAGVTMRPYKLDLPPPERKEEPVKRGRPPRGAPKERDPPRPRKGDAAGPRDPPASRKDRKRG